MENGSRAAGALLGLAGGVAGMMAMQAVRRGAQRALPTQSGSDEPESLPFVRNRHRRGEDATTAVGRVLFSTAFRREPSGREKDLAGHAVHWGYGLAMAAGYGLLRGRSRRASADLAGGALFGLGLWGLSDELVVPLLGLGDRPGAVPPRVHAQALAGHIGYGVATAATIHGLSRVLDTIGGRQKRGRALLPRKYAPDLRERLAGMALR